jgi:hypothetical protein
MHAVIGSPGCNIPDPCDPGPPLVNVPPGQTITVYLLFRNGSDIVGVQAAFDWGTGGLTAVTGAVSPIR